jgi:hypothetical protein
MVRHRVLEDEECCLFFLDLIARLLDDRLAVIRR